MSTAPPSSDRHGCGARRSIESAEALLATAGAEEQTDDIVLHYFGRSPLAGDHRGKPAALGVLAKVQQLANRQLLYDDDQRAVDELWS
jgi:hypothetical protein